MIPHDIFQSIIEMIKMKLLVSKDDGDFHYTLFIIIFCLLLQNSTFMEDILTRLNHFFFKKNCIVLEGKYIMKLNTWRIRNIFLFSTNFKALWYFLENNNYVSNNEIYKIKEYEDTSDYVDDCDNDIKRDLNSLFIVNQSNGFKITKDIYCNIIFTNFDSQEDILMLGLQYNFTNDIYFSLQTNKIDIDDKTSEISKLSLSRIYFMFNMNL